MSLGGEALSCGRLAVADVDDPIGGVDLTELIEPESLTLRRIDLSRHHAHNYVALARAYISSFHQ